MTNLHDSRLRVFLTVALFSDANTSAISDLLNFTINLTRLKAVSNQIQIFGEQQKLDKTGVTKSKNQLKAELIVLVADNARKIKAYAKLTNNLTLLGEVGITESDFKRCSDTALKDYAQIVYNDIQANYSITEATQASLLTSINAYNAVLSIPRGVTLKSQVTKQLVALFEEGNTVLAKMDAALSIFKQIYFCFSLPAKAG
ncbi:MAG: hypothetical protein HXX16_07420 [Bacteroidales bacterium]|nr:hypothetical protein [Bacteroidales bacterium]